jgi:integrase
MGKDWIVWFRIYDSSTKKWVQKSYKKGINNFKKYRERLASANSLRQDLLEALQEGWNPLQLSHDHQVKDLQITSLKEAFDFILKLKGSLRKKTRGTYKHITDTLKTWLDENKRSDFTLDHFTPQIAQQYMDYLLLKKKYAGRTFNDHLTILSTFFNVMIQRKWCMENPFKSIPRMKQTIGRNLAFTDHEKEKLRKALYKEDRLMYYFSQFVYYCFIRRTELVRIRVGDIDLQNKTIVIRGEDAKNDMQESVVIPVGLEPILKEMGIHHYPDDHFVFGRHLFPSDIPYSHVDHISGRHNKFVKRLGMDPQKGLYSWKHSGVCTAYYATGKDVYSLMRQLRHKELSTTMIYLKSLGLIQNDQFRNAMIA